MELTEIKNRIDEIGVRLTDIVREQNLSGYELAKAQGTDEIMGVSVAPLTEWARRMRELNTEWAELVAERKALREQKRGLRTCDCACH